MPFKYNGQDVQIVKIKTGTVNDDTVQLIYGEKSKKYVYVAQYKLTYGQDDASIKSCAVTIKNSPYQSTTEGTKISQFGAIHYGDILKIDAEAKPGYSFSSFTREVKGNTTIMDIAGTLINYTLTISQDSGVNEVIVKRNGVRLYSGATIHYGEELSITATPKDGYALNSYTSSVVVDGDCKVAITSYALRQFTIEIGDYINSVSYKIGSNSAVTVSSNTAFLYDHTKNKLVLNVVSKEEDKIENYVEATTYTAYTQTKYTNGSYSTKTAYSSSITVPKNSSTAGYKFFQEKSVGISDTVENLNISTESKYVNNSFTSSYGGNDFITQLYKDKSANNTYYVYIDNDSYNIADGESHSRIYYTWTTKYNFNNSTGVITYTASGEEAQQLHSGWNKITEPCISTDISTTPANQFIIVSEWEGINAGYMWYDDYKYAILYKQPYGYCLWHLTT